jgi:hypothetical protein
MRAPPFSGGLGAITLLFTAFGYFEDAENEVVLRKFWHLLAKNGTLLLDLPNKEYLSKNLHRESRRITPNGFRVSEHRQLFEQHVEKSVIIEMNGTQVGGWRERVRLYEQSEIVEIAKRMHFKAEFWPSLQGKDIDSGRMVAWLTKTDA